MSWSCKSTTEEGDTYMFSISVIAGFTKTLIEALGEVVEEDVWANRGILSDKI